MTTAAVGRLNVTRFADLIRATTRSNPRATAIVTEDRSFTYGVFFERVQRLAAGLLSLGLKPGDAVGILSENRFEYLEAYVACQWAGVVAVPVNFRLAADEFAYVLGNCEAKALLVEASYLPTIEALLPRLPTLDPGAIVVFGDDGAGRIAYDDLLARSQPLADAAPLPPDGASVIFYTSGTTGFPKGAKFSQLNMLSRLVSWGWEYQVSADDRVIVPGPIFHGSFSGVALLTLGIGGEVHLMRDFDARRASLVIDERGLTWGFLVPKMISLLLEECDPSFRGDSLRGLLSSGSPLPANVLADLTRRMPGLRIADAYGWTETGWLTICRHDDLMAGRRSVGRASFGCEIAVLGPDGEELPPGEVGEIYASSPVSFLGYHNNPAATERARHGRWETGGDVGYIDEEGFLVLVDRKNDMIISGGENIYPAEIERVIGQHPGVLEVAVVGVADATWGESPRACIVARPGETLGAAEMRAFLDGRLARYKHPRSYDFMEALPRNAMGKVLRRSLRDLYAAEARETAA